MENEMLFQAGVFIGMLIVGFETFRTQTFTMVTFAGLLLIMLGITLSTTMQKNEDFEKELITSFNQGKEIYCQTSTFSDRNIVSIRKGWVYKNGKLENGNLFFQIGDCKK